MSSFFQCTNSILKWRNYPLYISFHQPYSNLKRLSFAKSYTKMESMAQKVALKFTRVNFVPEKVTNRYYHRGNSVQIKSPTTTLTTLPSRNTRLFSPISVSKGAAGAGAGEEPELKTIPIGDLVSSEVMAPHDLKDERIAGIASAIRVIPDFPKPGTYFFFLFFEWFWCL